MLEIIEKKCVFDHVYTVNRLINFHLSLRLHRKMEHKITALADF